MDNTEIHYLTYDPDEIWETMIENYVEAGGDILYPGDEKEMLLRAVQADLVQVFAGVDNALRMQTLRYAVGEYLDLLGEQKGCERIQSAAATATVIITTNATGIEGTLAAGTSMTADGKVYYQLSEDVELTGYQENVNATIQASKAGEDGNGLAAGVQLVLAKTNRAVNSIVAATEATGGQNAEDDDTYRERIREYGFTAVTTGPATQYEALAKSVSSLILDAKAIYAGPGTVEIYLILSTQTGAEAIIQSVINTCSDIDKRPLTDHVSVYQAIDIPYVLNVQYTYPSDTSISDAVAEAVSEYQNWQDHTIGQAFNPDKLMALIYQAGATRVEWGAGSHFNNNEVAYTVIDSNERCKGTITVTGTAE